MPLSTDFGIFASNFEVFVINPYPSQVSQDIDLRPVPKQDGHSAPIIFELSPEPDDRAPIVSRNIKDTLAGLQVV